MNIEGCRRSDLRMDGKEANASLQTGRRDPGFPPESPGKVALGVKAQLLRHTGHTFPLLQQGESVSCVAEKLGFNSQSYFSRAFRRETGVTPSSLK